MLSDLLRLSTEFFLKAVNGLRAEGLSNIPPAGPLIIACNHRSNADPPSVLTSIFHVRPGRVMAKKELFSVPVVGWVLRVFHCIPVDRGRGDLGAIKTAVTALKNGDCLLLFPEGTRAKGPQPLEPKAGIGFIAAKSGAPVLTARIFGTEKYPFTRSVKVKFGRVLRFDEFVGAQDEKTAYIDFSKHVMQEIFSITEENAVGRKK